MKAEYIGPTEEYIGNGDIVEVAEVVEGVEFNVRAIVNGRDMYFYDYELKFLD